MWTAHCVLTGLLTLAGMPVQGAPGLDQCPVHAASELLELGKIPCVRDETGRLRFFAHSGEEQAARLREIQAAGDACLGLARAAILERLERGDVADVGGGIELLGIVIGTTGAKAALKEVFVVLDQRCEAAGGQAVADTQERERLASDGTHVTPFRETPSAAERYCGLRATSLSELEGFRDGTLWRIAFSRLLRASPRDRAIWYSYLDSAYKKDPETIATLRALLTTQGSPLEGDLLGKRYLVAIKAGTPVNLERCTSGARTATFDTSSRPSPAAARATTHTSSVACRWGAAAARSPTSSRLRGYSAKVPGPTLLTLSVVG